MALKEKLASYTVKAIILMGGKGMRFKSDIPKQFHQLAGKKVYLHTLERFINSFLFNEIVLVCHEHWLEEVSQDLIAYPKACIKLTPAGETRQESSYKGLLACGSNTDYVVIHDAVRPFVSKRILQENVLEAIKYGAVDTCIPSADTIVYSKNGSYIDAIPSRSEYLRGQTPQSFAYDLILCAHKHAIDLNLSNHSDDCSLIMLKNGQIHLIQGEDHNLKITTELDLFIAEQLFRLQNQSFATSEHSSSLRGKKFAITGGTGGIGQEVHRLLQKEGAIPLIISRSSSDYPANLTISEQAHKIFRKIFEEHGSIDGLINCIGSFKLQKVEDLDPSEIEELIAANLTGLIFACKYAFLKEGGHIINIASSSYSRGRKNFAIYSSAKAAVVNFTQGLAEERPEIKVNTLVPQRTRTKMRTAHFPDEDPTTLLSPEKVAEAIITALKESTLTGSIIEVRKEI